jgi:hypothetical protein
MDPYEILRRLHEEERRENWARWLKRILIIGGLLLLLAVRVLYSPQPRQYATAAADGDDRDNIPDAIPGDWE